MTPSSLEALALRLAAHLDCTQDIACQQILQVIAKTDQPLAPHRLAKRLQMSQEQLAAYLARVSDTEFDTQGNIVGWGITLQPTQHQFQLKESLLYTWCAFDTVLFPPLLQIEAQVQPICEVSGHPVSFLTTPQGIFHLLPATTMLSLV